MRRGIVVCFFLVVASLGHGQNNEPAKTGTILGTIHYLGDVPEAEKILTTDGNTILHRDIAVDGKTKGLRYVAVILDNPPAAKGGNREGPVIVDQRDMVFSPRVVALREGRKIRFENNDNCNHAVQAFSTKEANQFNVVTPQGQPFEFEFKTQKPPILLGCPIHNWMKAWAFVVPHPWFAISDAKGQFTIENVPVGKKTFLLSHPDTGFREARTLEVRGGENRWTIDLKSLKSERKTP